MFSNTYEIVYILKPDVTEESNLNIVNEYKKMIKKNGGCHIFVQHRGRRHLSYSIKHYYDAIYVQMTFQGNGNILRLVERSMRFNENIIRYLTKKQSSNCSNSINI
uniref:Small ribosomal subunit protein bS6c n=1 Tax=Hommersandiophycus borowitzkae TaxID=268573 RepID=A0A1G4NU37_9FLOR|nr:Ribosomal protein S6 [Hommersandiophycus borowitzkae]SCW22066.1 Ribosomal protein S6 [Hommersandiophycus borowitzkae]